MPRGVGLLGLFLVFTHFRWTDASLFQSCGTPSCLCFPDRALAACASLGARITRVPTFRHREVSGITGINLSRQAISRVRPADFRPEKWSSLQWIDLRENPTLDCSSLRAVPAGVKVLSDCPKDSTPAPQLPQRLPQGLPQGLPQLPQVSHVAARLHGKSGKPRKSGKGRDKAQSDASSSSSSSASVSLGSPGSSSSSSAVPQGINKTKGREVVVPFKGYFKLYLPDL